MKISILGFLIRVAFWAYLPIVAINCSLDFVAAYGHDLKFSLVGIDFLVFISYFILLAIINTFVTANNSIRFNYYLTHIYAVFYTIFKFILFPKVAGFFFLYSFFFVFLGMISPLFGSFVSFMLLLAGVYAFNIFFISPLMVYFSLPISYFFLNTTFYLLKNGPSKTLRLLFPAKLSFEERKKRNRQLNWLSFIRSANIFFKDEYHDMDISEVEVRNVKTAKKKSLKEDTFLKSQDAGMLSVALTHINRRDGGFSFDDFVRRATKVFRNVHNALYQRDISRVEHLLSDSLAQQLIAKIEEEKQRSPAQAISVELVINDIRIAQVNNDKNFDVLHLFVRAVSYDYYPSIIEKNISIEEIKRANKKLIERNYTEYYTFIRKPSAKTKKQGGLLEGQCPNCGTPLEIGRNTICSSCSSFIRSGAYDWVLSKITPAASWHYSEPVAISGYSELLKLDEDFSLQQVEERAATTYWILRKAAQAKSPKPLLHYALNSFITNFYEVIRSNRIDNYVLDEVVYESSYLKGITMDEDRVYCYCLSQTYPLKPKKGQPISKLVYVFSRKKNGKTKKHDTLSSIHCSNCGASLASSTETNCSYCNTSVNDDGTWLLDKIVTELDKEYMSACVKSSHRKMETKVQEAALSTSVTSMPHSAREIIMVSAQILMADGVIDPREKQLLTNIGVKYGMTDVEIDEVLDSIRQGLVYVPKPDSQSVLALETLRVAAKMALADGVVTDDEVDAIANLGLQMGYTKIDVMRIIKSEKNAIEREAERQAAMKNSSW